MENRGVTKLSLDNDEFILELGQPIKHVGKRYRGRRQRATLVPPVVCDGHDFGRPMEGTRKLNGYSVSITLRYNHQEIGVAIGAKSRVGCERHELEIDSG